MKNLKTAKVIQFKNNTKCKYYCFINICTKNMLRLSRINDSGEIKFGKNCVRTFRT